MIFRIFTIANLFLYSFCSTVQVSKITNLSDRFTSDDYLLKIKNEQDFSLKGFHFKIQNFLYSNLVAIYYSEHNQQRGFNNTFSSNDFYFQFQAPLKQNTQTSIKITLIMHKPFKFIPGTISLTEDQMIEYTDNIINIEFLDQLTIGQVEGKYILPSEIHNYTPHIISKVEYVNYQKHLIINPVLDFKQQHEFQVFYTQNIPFDLLKNTRRVIEVSMFGNLNIQYDYFLTNDGAKFEGELSNINYQQGGQPQQYGKHAISQNQIKLPNDIWRLSITDEIGNLTRCFARPEKGSISVSIIPRFSLFGGWNSTYYINYNQKSQHYLKVNSKDKNLYKLEYQFQHPMSHILSKNYELTICIPEYAELVSINLPVKSTESDRYRKKGIFELFGKDCFRYKYKNIYNDITQDNIEVLFRYRKVYKFSKLICLIGMIGLVFFVTFLISRIDMGFEQTQKKKKE